MQIKLKQTILLSVWVLTVAAGFWCLVVYANTSGVAAFSKLNWPDNTIIYRSSKMATLLIFGHPRCPCSQATIGELERLMPKLMGKVNPIVVFVKPREETEDWAEKDLWQRAKVIPDVKVLLDVDGKQANEFGARTSGQTFLYDHNGRLIFQGGITPSRGHMGDNLGRDAILSFVETGKTVIEKTSVFGCSLRSPERFVAKKETQ